LVTFLEAKLLLRLTVEQIIAQVVILAARVGVKV